jgi:23S rRNA (cytosine1962-C5)-methyltransferase
LNSRPDILDPARTNALRLVHGGSDGWPGVYIERLADHLLLQSADAPDKILQQHLAALAEEHGCHGVYFKQLRRDVRKTDPGNASPELIQGTAAPERFTILENGIGYEASFGEGYSYGLFLDQRDNRARWSAPEIRSWLPAGHYQPARLLNAFAYTCAFSVCAAKCEFETTSLDLSRKYLDWGRRNFDLNDLDPDQHDFIYGDVFEWFKRLHNKGRRFEAIVLDPPTFSKAKKNIFKADRDYGRLIEHALPLLESGGILFASTNAAQLSKSNFLNQIRSEIVQTRRDIQKEVFVGQPPDFPVSPSEPAYLKTAWFQVG